jgi:hypothetical protein
VRLLSNLIFQLKPGGVLAALDKQPSVFRLYWPMASAESFQPVVAAHR